MRNKLFYFINTIILAILVVMFAVVQKGADTLIIWFCLLIFYIHFFSSIRQPLILVNNIKTYMKIDTFFMLFFYIIYCYPYQLYVLGFKDLGRTAFLNKTYSEFSNVAIIASTIGLTAFQLGYHHFKNAVPVKTSMVVSQRYMNLLFKIILTLTIFTFLIFANTGLSLLIAGAYAGSSTGIVTYDAIYTLVTFFVLLSLAQAIAYYFTFKKIPLLSFVAIGIAVGWAALLLIMGDRNTFFIVAILGIAGFYTYIKSVTRLRIAAMMFGALVLYQVVEVSRTSQQRSLSSLWDTFLNLETQSSTSHSYEIGSFDITTIGSRATFKAVPGRHDFFLGRLRLIGLTSIIPYSSRLIVDKDEAFTGTSNVLKEEMIGKYATWGVGTNIITDCYMDYGLVGIIGFMYLIGWFGGFIKNKVKMYPTTPKWIFLYLITICYYSELSRYGMDFPLRSIVWTFFLFYFIDKKFVKQRIVQPSDMVLSQG